jgi:SSS family solute:Na+ symporter
LVLLIGQNGMSYQIGLPLLNLYLFAFVTYSLLIYVFLPVYLRNGIMTMPEYLQLRFGNASANLFTVLLLLSYVFLSLAVVFYGGAKLLEIVVGLDLQTSVVLIGCVAGVYTMYGGMASMSYAAAVQSSLIFIAGATLFYLGYVRLPNGWSDVVAAAPCGFHITKPLNYPEVPWLAMPASLLGLQLYYSCMNQSLVQPCFGARSHWDARMAIILAGFAVLVRPFVEILPGMICRALSTFDPQFALGDEPVDNVFPMLVQKLIPTGLIGLILVGILSSVMSTIAALLNSVSTIFTMNVYRNWFDPTASEHRLVRVGTTTTFLVTLFCICYSPLVGKIGGSIFNYFQTGAAYFAAPVATVFLFGFFWKRATSAAAVSVLAVGIPLGFALGWGIPTVFRESVVSAYGLGNRYVVSGITQCMCAILFVVVSLITRPKHADQIRPLMWSIDCLYLPQHEKRRPMWQSVELWWGVMALTYILVFYLWW